MAVEVDMYRFLVNIDDHGTFMFSIRFMMYITICQYKETSFYAISISKL
jgi:hypothetical protein